MKIIDKYKVYVGIILASVGLAYYSSNNLSISEGINGVNEIIKNKNTVASNKSETEYKQRMLTDIQILKSKIDTAVTHRTNYSELDILGKVGELTNRYKTVKLTRSRYLTDIETQQQQEVDIPVAQTTQQDTESDIPTPELESNNEDTDDSTALSSSATEESTSESLLLNAIDDIKSDDIFSEVYDDNYKYLGITLESSNSNELILFISDLESIGLRYKYLNLTVESNRSIVDLCVILN